MKKLFKDNYGLRPWAMLVTVVASALLLIVVVTAVVAGVAYRVERSACYEWADVSGRETRFERLAFLEWDCFTKMPDGTWLPKDSLRGVEESRDD